MVSKTQTILYNPARSTAESLLAEDPYLKQQQAKYRNLVDVYLDQVRRFPRLDASQETLPGFSQLAQTHQNWQRLIHLLVQANLRLVVHHALRYRRQRDSLLLDLIQEGNLGLLRAARKFDIRMGCRFSTYASFWIRLFLDQAAVRRQGAVQRPLKIDYLMRRFGSVHLKLEHTQGEQGLSQSLRDTNLCPSQWDDWLQFEQAVLSFDTWLEDGGKEFAEQLSQSDDSLWQEEQPHRAIRESLKILSNRKKEILQCRFGLGN